MKPITINSKLGTSERYFPSKSYLYMKYEQEIIHSASGLNTACYRVSFWTHRLTALLLQTGGGLFQPELTKKTAMFYFESFCFLRKATYPIPCRFPAVAPSPSFSPKHFKPVKHFIYQTL